MENTEYTNTDTSDEKDTIANDIKKQIKSIDSVKYVDDAGETKKLILGFALFQLIENVICSLGIFFFVGFSLMTVLGIIVGYILSIVNFALMIRTLSKAAQNNDDPVRASNLIKLSYVGRMIGIGAVIVILSLLQICDLIALAIPVLTTKPTLYLQQFIRKSGDKK